LTSLQCLKPSENHAPRPNSWEKHGQKNVF
jgi:hypothetical protein